MCEAEDELYAVQRENDRLRARLRARKTDDFGALCDAIEDMRLGIASPEEVIDLANRLAHACEHSSPDLRTRKAA